MTSVTGVGYTPPSGVANLAVTLLLAVALITRPNGLTNGREIPWLADFKRRRNARRTADEHDDL
jgi:hypothetical protein